MECYSSGFVFLLVFLLCLVSSSQLTMTEKQYEVITTPSECGRRVHVHSDLKYVLQMKLRSFPCNEPRLGFTCSFKIEQIDAFERLGTRICIDLQGVPKTIPNSQLYILVYDVKKEIKRLYYTSRLMPMDRPYYKCTDQSRDKMRVKIGVRDSVDICKEAAGQMINHNISLGTVALMSEFPIYQWTMEKASESLYVREAIYMLKVVTDDSSSSSRLNVWGPPNSANTKACITLLYVSDDYSCQVQVELHRDFETLIQFKPRIMRYGRREQLPLCYTYAKTSQRPELRISKSASHTCKGKFALNVSFSYEKDDHDNGPDREPKSNRHLYMAVFISLISVCLLALGLTCVCCLRIRSKRYRRSQQRRNRAVSSGNPGFDVYPMDPSIPTVSWSTSNPGQVAGLPTYEEVVGQSSDGTGDPVKVDKPPPYESLFSKETSVNS